MYILHVYKDYYPVLGGIENHLRMVARAQVRWGHDVTVLVTNPHGSITTEENDGGVRVIRAGKITTVASTPISISLPRCLRREEPDIVHLHFPYPMGEVSQWLLRRGRGSVLTYHSDVIRQAGILRLYNPLLKRILRGVDRIIATSEPYIRSSPYLRPLADRCTVIPLAIDVTRFSEPQPKRVAAIRHRYAGPILLFVGRLRYYKGLPYLLEAMRQIPGTLIIAGTGPEAATLGEQTYLSGIADRVHFLGDVSDAMLPAYYQAADLFVLPSSHRSEAFGIVLLEAMASGTPVISTELSTGTSWVNQSGTTGLVVPPRDPDALAQAVNSLTGDHERMQEMAMNAQARAREEFDLPILIDRLLTLYEDILDGKEN